jgi:hypothetical protein
MYICGDNEKKRGFFQKGVLLRRASLSNGEGERSSLVFSNIEKENRG